MTDQNQEIVIKSENFIKLSTYSWKFLRFINFDSSSNNQSSKSNFINRIIFIIHILTMIIFGVISPCGMYHLPIDIRNSIAGISRTTVIFLTVTKYTTIILNEEKIRMILEQLNGNYTKVECKIFEISSKLENFKKVIKRYLVYVSLPILSFFLEPISAFIESGQLILPFSIEFPFDATKNVYIYSLSMLYIFYFLIMNVLLMIGSDQLLYGLIKVLTIEFEKLKFNFENLFDKNCEDFKRELKNLIRRHEKLLEISKEIQNIFSVLFTLNFFVSSFFICFVAFMCSITDAIPELLFYFGFLIFTMLQIFFQCYYGQALIDSSENLNFGVYNCKWEKIDDLKLKKDIVFLLSRTQKPAKFLILNFSMITIEQFQNVLSASYSYFTLCRYVYLKA
ncbi:hypothetical protein PVAND_016625 [Polypedilum vanderplanki]|uniref:Odorant receptor n=1 Tax=Polypedilum vanderplanki TaxID=319348 RepID=A0A9J6BGB6_POLVA|nr:hypothetical protein PVAND_016625 [Polypedilum vanderplanki]